jgi:SPP1 family phage portal protein
MSDTAFGGNASGVAIKYKTLPMENVVAIKERKFKRGLQRRIELIFNIVALKGTAFDWRAIDIAFTRNLPTNDTEVADMVYKLSGKVSQETLLAQVPFVEDVGAEITRLKDEHEANPFYDVRLGLNGEDEDERAREDKEKE